jgi:hypothetical protein
MTVDNSQFTEEQMLRQTAALEATAKKVATIGIIISLWFVLTVIGVIFLLLTSLTS